MHYRNTNELVLRDGETASFIHKNERSEIYARLNTRIQNDINDNSLYTTYKDEYVHTVSEVMNICPMILNTIAQLKFEKIVFVGHFNASQLGWLIDVKSDRVCHVVPPERSMERTIVDPNIIVQFLPIIAKEFGYEMEIDVVAPPESRHRQLMHSLYQQYNLNRVTSNKQYKHGITGYELEGTGGELYDAAIFAGVPRKDEDTRFSYNHVSHRLQPYCKYAYHKIDLWYGNADENRWVEVPNKPITPELVRAFSNRAAWDSVAKEQDLSYDYTMLEDMVKLYR